MAVALTWSGTAWGQAAPSLDTRVSRLEAEMRAVQRKVFPDGAGRTVEPQTAPSAPPVAPGEPATSPIADLTARVAALEDQLRSVTNGVEQGQDRLRRLGERVNGIDARLHSVEAATSTAGADATGDTDNTATPPPPARPVPGKSAAAAPDRPARATAVPGVEKPDTGDAANDGYIYGYNLWQAKHYAEAQAVLKEVVDKYPDYRRASYARNLLGRALLDGGSPSQAAVVFYENYKKLPDGDRAPESLYYLAQALVKLKKPAAEVCKVYSELTDVYGKRIPAELQARVVQGRTAAKCR
jgi:TolA-binding protein